MNGVWGLRLERSPGAVPLAIERSKLVDSAN
jgi:hypothetical protein